MHAWLLDLVACAGCGARLAVVPGAAPLLACRGCGARFPVLGGVPVVVPSPADYLAGYRDAALAALAERGRAPRVTVAVVDAFARAGARTEPLAFGDDWVSDEGGTVLPTDDANSGAAATFRRFLAETTGDASVDAAILAALPTRRRTVVEIGAGAGVLARQLARTSGVERLLVADLSLRAALRAAGRSRSRRNVAAAVLDAEALPLAPRSVDVIVAAELVDLLAAPERLLRAAAVALRPRGRLIIATPDPSLGGGDDDRLRALLRRERWRIAVHHRAIPWVRPHTPRHYQVYFTDVVAAER